MNEWGVEHEIRHTRGGVLPVSPYIVKGMTIYHGFPVIGMETENLPPEKKAKKTYYNARTPLSNAMYAACKKRGMSFAGLAELVGMTCYRFIPDRLDESQLEIIREALTVRVLTTSESKRLTGISRMAGISNKVIARKVGCADNTIWRKLHSVRHTTPDDYAKICAAIGAPAVDYLAATEPEYPF